MSGNLYTAPVSFHYHPYHLPRDVTDVRLGAGTLKGDGARNMIFKNIGSIDCFENWDREMTLGFFDSHLVLRFTIVYLYS